jgi:hypothetical protein
MGWFRSSSRGVRFVSLAGLVAATFGFLTALGKALFPEGGYGAAQSYGACRLEGLRDDWATFVRGTGRDLFVFIPVYFLLFLGIVFVTRRAAPSDHGQRGWPERLASDRLAVGLAIGAAATDVVETVLFRRTLHELQAGRACSTLTTATDVTAGFTVAKFALWALFFLCVGWRVVKSPK